ncbi:hypothetical protein [Lewinella cohaerens]|uniref:hypothetical protein n=1 Tax=Lewinella cohaerens TaxID=70995 RepID=UPI000364089D|nr:hypothetical protein [Lewinella cohaerens]
MTFLELQTQTAPDASGNCTLSGSDFPEDVGVARLLEVYFVGGEVALSGAAQTSNEEEEIVKLTGILQSGFLGLPVLAGKAITFSGAFSLSTEIPDVSIVLTFDDDWSLVEALTEGSDLSSIDEALNIDIAKKLAFPVKTIELESGTLSVTLNISPNKALGLSELSEYVQGAEIVSQFPTEGFPSFTQNLIFESFGIGARIEPVTLTFLTAEVALNNKNTNWAPFGDLIEFKELRAAFLLMNPLGGATASIHIQATALIADKEIIAAVDLPSMVFQCMLGPDETIQLKELLAMMGVEELPMPEVVCDELEVVGDPASSTFELFVGFETKIELDLLVTTLSIDELRGHFTLITGPEREIGAEMFGKISFGDTAFDLSASSFPGEPGWIFTGGLSDGSELNFGKLITDLASSFDGMPGRPSVLEDSLIVTNLQVAINTQTKDFHFLCEIEFPLDGKTAHLLLNIDIINTTGELRKTFSGVFTLGARELSVVFDKTTTTSSLIAAFKNEEGEEINLVRDVVELVSDGTALDLPDDGLNLLTLKLYLLEFSYFKDTTAALTRYGIKGDFAWEPKLGLSSDPNEAFKVRATVDLTKEKGTDKHVLGTICGRIDSPIDGLEFLSLQACYNISLLTPTEVKKELLLQLQVGRVGFEAVYVNTDGDIDLKFGINIGDSLTLGEVASFFISLVDPSVIEYEFDPPWDALASINLASFINSIKLNLIITKDPVTKRSVTSFGVTLTNLNDLLPSALKPFISITELGINYQAQPATTSGGKKKSTKQVKVKILGTFLGEPNKTLEWDPLNDKAPEVPGQGISMFDLRYLGLGQRVAITQASNVASIGEVMELLRGVIDEGQAKLIADRSLSQQNPLAMFGDNSPISFSPESEWLIGLDVSLLKVLKLTVIFNDPVIYGLRIELDGEMAKNFAGLKFEILYQKVTDDVGKYHIDLTLPDFVRHFTVGAVSVTLPLIVIDIFTNGDFKLDFGFPWNFNFSRSFAIEVFPFTGAGGFYFNKLSAATATSTPAVVNGTDGEPVGVFTPVYEFGLGLKIGLGKTFNSGPLKAEISITVQGMIEGVISWYNPRSGGDKELYYAIRGGVAIVGRLYGEVDFVVVSVSVEVIAKATVQFMVESYKDILVKLSAEVSVKAKAKVLFVTVKFKFSMKVEQSFTINGPQHGITPPWQISTASRSIRAMAMQSRSLFAWNWENQALWVKSDTTPKLDIFFQPAYTWVNDSASSNSGKVKGEALLFIENATGEDREDFATLGNALFQWTCQAGGISDGELSLNEVSNLYDEFVAQADSLFSFEQLSTFLFTHFDFRIQAQDGVMDGTIFPMFPQLSLTLGEAAEDGSITTIKFDEIDYQLSAKQLEEMKAYFAKLKVQFTSDAKLASPEQAAIGTDSTPITSFIFSDYFKIIIRAALQAAKDELEKELLAAKTRKIAQDKEDQKNGITPAQTLEEFVDEQREEPYSIATDILPAIDFEPIANMASRFLMHGLCLPTIPQDGNHEKREKQPLYQATGQQFDFADAKVGKKYTVTLQDEDNQAAFKFGAGDNRSFAYQLDEFDVDASKVRFALANTVHILDTLSGSDVPISKAEPSLIDFYGDEDNQINFALRKGMAWGTDKMLIDFPKSLTAYLQRKVNNPSFDFSQVPLSDDQPEIEDRTPVTNFKLATRIDINIKRILNAEGTEFLPNTYLLLGTSEGEKDLLEAILENIATVETLSLVYTNSSSNAGAVINDFGVAAAAVVIVKANLSTGNKLATTQFSGTMDNAEQFLRLVWEGSTASTGGYYLKIPHDNANIDEELFRKESVGQISLLVEFPVDFKVDTTSFVPADFHTAAILGEVIDLEEELLLAQSEEQVPVLRIPAGHLGFEHRRDEIQEEDHYTEVTLKKEVTPKAAPDDAAADLPKVAAGTVAAINTNNGYVCIASGPDRLVYGWVKIDSEVVTVPATLKRNELDNIYQLLGYKISNHPLAEKNDVEGLPIGPTDAGEQELFERIIPTFDGQAADEHGLPAPNRNPYLGISDQVAIKVDTWWQDLYGNKLSLDSKAGAKSFTLGYTDPIIGLNQWPSVLESYRVTKKSDSVATLSLDFSFNHSGYLADKDTTLTTREKAVNAALAKYEQVYFQLKAADVALTLKTTLFEVNPTAGHVLDKTQILTFVETIYKFLKEAQDLIKAGSNDAPSTSVAPFSASVDLTFKEANLLKFQKEFIYDLTVFVEITRSESLVHSSLLLSGSINPAYENVTKSIDYLSPKQTDLGSATSLTTTANQMLQQLVVASNGLASTAADLLRTNLQVTGLLIDDVLLSPADLAPDFGAMKLRKEDWEALLEITPAATVSTGEGSSFEQLRGRFEIALNDLRESEIDKLQASFSEALDNLENHNESINQLLADKQAELDGVSDENDSERQSIEEKYRPLLNPLLKQQNLDLQDARRQQVAALRKLQNPIIFTIEDLAAVLSNTTDILTADVEWKLPKPSPLHQFAKDFETALPGLCLAVSEDRDKKNQAPDETRPLYVVQIGAQGVSYDIQEQLPTFYAIPPMANTLLSGKVLIDSYGSVVGDEKQFDAIDINGLARDFLVAVEDFLEPDSLLNAHQLAQSDTEAVIAEKSTLAKAISDLIEPVLQDSMPNTSKTQEAQTAIQQQMLVNLVEGYDVETIVQFEVAITVGDHLANASELTKEQKPKVVGKAKVVRILQGEDPRNLVEVNPREFDFSLSLGKISLTNSEDAPSSFTYLFDTKTPEKYANLYLELEFHSVGIEYAIETVSGAVEYQASNWLTLIRPDNLKQSMGQSAIPIPLRDFPMPPSLIFQRAEPDPSSREILADVRQWKYTIMFEHLDVAQDKVDCLTRLNQELTAASTTDGSVSAGTTPERDTLFESLVNFSQIYPELAKDLSLFRNQAVLSDSTDALAALAVFKNLVKEVASHWEDYTIPAFTSTYESVEGDLHYEISEEPLGDLRQGFVRGVKTIDGFNGEAAPDPILELPGFKEFVPTSYEEATKIKTFTYEEDPEDQTFFGDSSIPDRKFMIENLDVIPHQNAWASIWLSRNKGLLKNADNTDIPTNPKFVFQTPAVRFNNMVTPVIINDEPWNLGNVDIVTTNGDKSIKSSLKQRLTEMFNILFPDAEGQKNYEVQLSCRYAFALANGLGLNDDLKPTLPVLLGLRLSSANRSSFGTYPEELAIEIDTWWSNNKPSSDDASLIFSISLFSKLDSDDNTSLPMLRIEHLEMNLIADQNSRAI